MKHITNYVVLWNTSTKPHPLWICYDYYRPDFDGCGRRGKLGKPTYYNAEEDDEFGPQGCAFPLEENTDPDEEIPGGRDISSTMDTMIRTKMSLMTMNSSVPYRLIRP